MGRLGRRAFVHGSLLAAAGVVAAGCAIKTGVQEEPIDLPSPDVEGQVALEVTLANRRSVRRYTSAVLSRREVGQLLWAAQGVTRDWGARTAPSAGALYPLEVYVVTAEGLYHYIPHGHRMTLTPQVGLREKLWAAGLKQDCIRQAPAVFVVAAVYERTSVKYGERAARYVYLEAGHAAENLLLQAVALGLGGVPVGAFYDDQVQTVLGLSQDQEPIYLVPVGYPGE